MKTYNREIEEVTFSISVDEDLYRVAQELLESIEKTLPYNFNARYSVYQGFNVFGFVKNKNGYQVVVQDYSKNPFKDKTRDLSTALRIHTDQNDMLRSYDLPAEYVRFDESIAVAKDAFDGELVLMQREDYYSGHSGWMISSIPEEDVEVSEIADVDFEYIHAYRLLAMRPALVKALAMPYGYSVVFQGDEIVRVLDEDHEPAEPTVRESKDLGTDCSKDINGIAFVAKALDVVYPMLETVFSTLEKTAPDNYREGFSFQVGFNVFTLAQNGSGFRILAPNYYKNPLLDTTEDLTIPLWIQMDQESLLKTYNLDAQATRFDDRLTVATDSLQQDNLALQRRSDLKENGSSGWSVNSMRRGRDGNLREATAKDYESLNAFQLLTVRPELLTALVLPYGYRVFFKNDNIVKILDENGKNIMENIMDKVQGKKT